MPIAARNQTNHRRSSATSELIPNQESIVGRSEEDDLLIVSEATLMLGIRESQGK